MSKKFFYSVIILLMIIITSFGCEKYDPNKTDGYSGGGAFNLQSSGVVTSVKNQGTYQSDWAFAVMAAMESDYLYGTSQRLNNGSAGNSMNLDLSEMHLAWFAYKSPVNKHNIFSYTSNGRLITEIPDNQVLDLGGDIFRAAAILSRGFGFGPVSENSMQYAITPTANEGPENYVSIMRLTDVSIISPSDESSERDTIKNLIREKGALYFEFDYVDSGLNTQMNAYYYPDPAEGNTYRHSAVVIGWDDNYSMSYFNEGSRPSTAGAWIVKNSFGSEWGQFGYCRVSYEQSNLLFAALTAEDSDANLIHYGYDDLGYCYAYPGTYAANLFGPEDESKFLTEIGYYNLIQGSTVDIKVYTYDTKPTESNLSEGSEIFTTKLGVLYPGYHTLKLDESLEIPAGKYFSIVMNAQSGAIAAETRLQGDTMNAVAYDGESYFSDDGSNWIDGTEMTDSNGNHVIMNACIKAFCVKVSGNTQNYSTSSQKTIGGLNIMDYDDLQITVTGDALAKYNSINQIDVNNEIHEGTDFSLYPVDNQGNLLPAGTQVNLTFIRTNAFYLADLTPVSENGINKLSLEGVVSIYPESYKPDYYLDYDGVICPVYGTYSIIIDTETENEGLITIDTNALVRSKSSSLYSINKISVRASDDEEDEENELEEESEDESSDDENEDESEEDDGEQEDESGEEQEQEEEEIETESLPAGYYRVIYSVGNSIVGELRNILIE